MSSSKAPSEVPSEAFNFGKALGNELVIANVGEEKHKFTLHKDLLCNSVEYFRAAFAPDGFKESHDSVIDMPEDDPKVFELFVHWLYRGTIAEVKSRESEDIITLFDLYIFAEKLCINELANKTMDALQNMGKESDQLIGISVDLAAKICGNTSLTSPLRKFCLHSLLHKYYVYEPNLDKNDNVFLDEKNLLELWEIFKDNCDIYVGFFTRAQKSLSRYRVQKYPGDISLWKQCYFHRHSQEEICHR
ncbi:hypothetical protein NHQ30_010625 [Ciborinia camelliae]|nr:hypothetical protein NHQ30_010625 [Ciborinia camelliae]